MTGAYPACVHPDDDVDAFMDRAAGVYRDLVRERVAIGAAGLEGLMAFRLGLDPEDPATRDLMSELTDDVLEDPLAPLVMLPPDVVVHVPALTAGAVLTHRLTAAEQADGRLDLDADLACFLRVPDPHAAGAPLHVEPGDGTHAGSWYGREDWLAHLPADALLAVRVAQDGAVELDVLDAEPDAPPGLVPALRGVYERELDEPGLPVTAESLLLGLLHADRSAFAQPRPPLAELAARAGLDRRGGLFAHAPWVWAAGEEAERHYRLLDRLGPGEHSAAALTGLDLLAGHAEDPAALRRALDLLQEPDVLVAAVEEWLGADDDQERVAALGAVADRLVMAAGRSPRAAVARWIAAVAAERAGRVLDAESHLRAAVREADGWPFTEDRLAWYESDRGEAAAALGRWTAIGMATDDPLARVLAPFAVAAGPEPGRNEPCWCGTGRKYKQCHLGRPRRAPLPERVGWLCRKADAYLDRRGGAVEEHLLGYADLRLLDGGRYLGADPDGGPDAALAAALADPVVRDVVLHEGGWFASFLAERGPLLPADEAELAASWPAVERSVHEVLAVSPGAGVTVRDLRTDERTDVTERAFSRTAAVGQLVCARAVPDGVGHQFVGSILTVPSGQEDELLEVLAERDGESLLVWLVDQEQEPDGADAEQAGHGRGAADPGAADPGAADRADTDLIEAER